MAYITKRFYTQGTGFASSIAAKFLRNASKNGPTTRAQLLDSNQVQKLSLVLNRPHLYLDTPITSDPLPDGTPIPPGYHLVFFTPSAIEQDLSIDGTDRSVNPPHPFTRRMWAGGELIWTGKENPLRVGQIVRETTELVSAEAKKSKTGDEMIIVGTKKTFANENGIALVDKRWASCCTHSTGLEG
jgi:hydroxyacyl-ACP dehydratase HTD2-like protein with hotdog domain